MHELAVTESILEIALRHAQQANAAKITAMNIVIGQLASIVDDSVQFYWDIISANTPAQGAQLNFRRVPAQMQCRDCGFEFSLNGKHLPCPQCGSILIKVLHGEEFFLESIEIELEQTA